VKPGREFFFKGAVRVEISGMDRERFFNIAASRGLKIAEISESGDGAVSFLTTCSDFKRMKPAVRKAGVRLSIRGKYGLPFFIHKNRKRKLLAAGAVCFFLLLYSMTFFIWDISFEGNARFTDEMLLHFMETVPAVYGMRKSEISCEALEEAIRNQFTEITWVSAEIKGTRLIIRVKENEAVLTPEVPDTSPCDLAALKDGVITGCIIRSGFGQVKAGDEVKAGDLLVDGTVPIYDDSETLINSHEVRADGEIYAKTVHEIRNFVPFTHTVHARTGKRRPGFFVSFGGRTLSFLMPAAGEADWEYVTEEGQLKIFRDFCLPVYYGKITAYEFTSYEETYTEEEVRAIGDRHRKEYMEKLSEKGIQILGDDGKIEKDESGWKTLGTLTVIENIAGPVPAVSEHEENQTVNEFN